ncbi:MAG: hypothetical protein GY839_15870 [candidate division Zixibacteria bacterium]|nr:hypothetical protein [candidate division Zixibacteria bacterium]
MGKEDKLLELAETKFGELSPADIKLFTAVAKGDMADYSSANEDENDPVNAENWGEERQLAADRIEWLCSGGDALSCVSNKGIWINGVCVNGELNLNFIEVSIPFLFLKCSIPDRINLHNSKISALAMPGTFIGSMMAFRLIVEHDVFLRDGFHAEGEVNLIGANIQGDLSCGSGKFINSEGKALAADGINVDGSVLFSKGFMAEGAVRLLNAYIGGNLECDSGVFINPSKVALSADKVIVKGSVFLRSKVKVQGEINFFGSDIKGSFQLRDFIEPSNTVLKLRTAHIGTLWDDEESWPEKGNLRLDGFTYDSIYGKAPLEPQKRIEWLKRQPESEYHPQPYEQLAKFYHKSGRDEYAKQILIAKNEDEAYLKQLNCPQKIWHKMLKYTVGYGYRPLRALYWGLAIMAIGALLFWSGADLISPTRVISEDYPKLNPIFYSIDMFVPLVNLHQAEFWLPNANKGAWGAALQYYMWFHIFAGWFLSTLLAVGLSGLVKK